MGIRRKPKKANLGSHYMVMSRTLNAYICITEHETNCGEIRDRFGQPITLKRVTELLEQQSG